MKKHIVTSSSGFLWFCVSALLTESWNIYVVLGAKHFLQWRYWPIFLESRSLYGLTKCVQWGRQYQLSVHVNLHRTVNLGLCSLNQCFTWFYLGFDAKTLIRTTFSFLEHMFLLPTNFLSCTNQVQMSCCCYFKYLQLEIMGSWSEFSYNFWYPLLSSCCTCHTLCTI